MLLDANMEKYYVIFNKWIIFFQSAALDVKDLGFDYT